MASYMTVVVSGGTNPNRMYYRKQRGGHPSHDISSAFTNAAIAHYAQLFQIGTQHINTSNYNSNQGAPNRPNAIEI